MVGLRNVPPETVFIIRVRRVLRLYQLAGVGCSSQADVAEIVEFIIIMLCQLVAVEGVTQAQSRLSYIIVGAVNFFIEVLVIINELPIIAVTIAGRCQRINEVERLLKYTGNPLVRPFISIFMK